MTLTTPGLQESIDRGWPTAAMVAIHHAVPAVFETWADGVIRLWDGIGILRYDGKDWRGIGPFGRLVGVGGSKQLMLRTVTFELFGIPAEVSVYLDPQLRNKRAQAWIAGLDEFGRRVNGLPFQEIDGKCDYQELSADESGIQTINLMVGEPIYSIERAQTLKYTAEWANEWLRVWRQHNLGGQRVTGYDRIAELADATRSWTQS